MLIDSPSAPLDWARRKRGRRLEEYPHFETNRVFEEMMTSAIDDYSGKIVSETSHCPKYRYVYI